ncbi:uncharacterized protein LOC124106097 [Marmota monax]|uniref:uncharacterized protein LOC124106097 n=1 Tax=Marmota monax TaxID=9995 RepID=UPI0026EF21AA|nr:uncharacterized protein LOC124106097 [Marmota monax]
MAPRSKKKAPNGRTHTRLGLRETVPVLASPRGVWELGENCRLGDSYTSVQESFRFPTPLPRPTPPPSSGSNNSSSQTIQKRPGPGGRPLRPPPCCPPPSLSARRGAISFRAVELGSAPAPYRSAGKRPEGTVLAAVAAPNGVAVTATVATASTQWVMSHPSSDPYRSLGPVWESWARGRRGRVARKCQPRSPPSGQVEELLGSPGLNRGGRGLRSRAFLRTWLRSRGCGAMPRPALLPLREKHLGPPFPSAVTQCTASLYPKDCASESVRGRSSFSPLPLPTQRGKPCLWGRSKAGGGQHTPSPRPGYPAQQPKVENPLTISSPSHRQVSLRM